MGKPPDVFLKLVELFRKHGMVKLIDYAFGDWIVHVENGEERFEIHLREHTSTFPLFIVYRIRNSWRDRVLKTKSVRKVVELVLPNLNMEEILKHLGCEKKRRTNRGLPWKIISVKLPEEMIKRIDDLVMLGLFESRSEAIRHMLFKALKQFTDVLKESG